VGAEQGTVSRVARQLGYGVESVRSWVRQADVDDGRHRPDWLGSGCPQRKAHFVISVLPETDSRRGRTG
jgi:transposase-like protein